MAKIGKRASEELMLMVARLYYEDGLSQADTARLANISQAKVSRLLAKARKTGIVKITVAEYDPSDQELENQLIDRLGLLRAKVIRVPAALDEEELRQSVAHFAASWVAERIPPKGVLAISGGRAMRWLSQRMTPSSPTNGLTVVQAMGNIDASVGPYDALELGRVVAQRWQATFLTLNTLAILPDAQFRDRLLALDSVQMVMQRLRAADVAIVGLGTTRNSVFVERGVLTPRDAKRLENAGTVGEICGRFFDQHGNECRTPLRDRVVGIELESLRKIPEVIGMVVGRDRAAAIQGAVRGKLIKSLVIDQQGAQALVGDR
jgi:deoxyribonucleoside regulator